ncbi:MAG TPA: hypothetical protein VJH94_01630 [Candidatus Paceibacterota bacterium]
MENPEILPHSHRADPEEVERQANCQELDSIILFERLQNPEIRRQMIDMIEKSEHQQVRGERRVDRDPHGKPRRTPDRKIIWKDYEPKSREEIEATIDKNLASVENATVVFMNDVPLPHVHRFPDNTRVEVVPLCWKVSTEQGQATTKQMAIAEAHEKGHIVRPFRIDDFASVDAVFLKAFDQKVVTYTREDYENLLKLYPPKEDQKTPSFSEQKEMFFKYLFRASELAERMSQLKNYFGITGNEEFTKDHLDYAREHYIKDTGMDNLMTKFFQAITLEKEEDFLELINSAGI